MAEIFSRVVVINIIFLMALSIPLFNYWEEQEKIEQKYGGDFRVKSFESEFSTQLDPASPEAHIFVIEQIYDGLVRVDKNLNIVPSLADYWEISPDGKKYTFYLRRGVKFHHGGELSAEDVKYSFERLFDEEIDSPSFQLFLARVEGAKDFRERKTGEVKGFKVLDKYKFEIHLEKPFVSTLYLMSMHFCKILPRNLVLKQGKGFFSKPSGTGPFMFDYWVRTTRLDIAGVRLKRNEEYFGAKPRLEVVEFCPLFTLDNFLKGEIESIPVLSDKLLKSGYQIFQDGSLHQIFLGMSCHIPPFDRPMVRKAISYALNKRDIARDTYDMRYVRKVTNNYIPPRLTGFFPRDDEMSYDLEKARRMLRKAGFTIREEFPPLTLFLDFPRSELKNKIYRALREQLDSLGIKLRTSYYKTFEEIRSHKKPYLVLLGRVMNFPDPEDIIRPLFLSNSTFNVFGYSNPELDKLLQEAEIERSWTKRIDLFHRIEKILFSDVPAVPLFSHQNRIVMQSYVRGIEEPPLGFHYFDVKKIWLDK